MAEAFGGVYVCSRKHKTAMWFFDSKPDQRPCPRCEDGRLAKLIHVKDYSAGGKMAAENKRKDG